MCIEVYTTDGSYSLVKLTEQDKDKYMELLIQTSAIEGFYNNPANLDLMWRIAFDGSEQNYSIYDISGEYCGNITLKHPSVSTPEIGIDLMENMRNKGIAAKSIKMLARKVYEERDDIEYFVLRVSSENPHSRHMIEKMSAIYVGKEETLIKRAMKLMPDFLGEEAFKKTQENYKEFLEENPDAEDEVVYRYKLTPELFI